MIAISAGWGPAELLALTPEELGFWSDTFQAGGEELARARKG